MTHGRPSAQGKSKTHSMRGFTLIEMLLSFGLLALFSVTTYSFAWNIADLNTRGEIARAVAVESRFISERIFSLVRNSDGIASVATDRVELEKAGASGVTAIFLRDGALFVDDGYSEEALSESGVAITNVLFEDYRAESGFSESLGFSITVSSDSIVVPNSVFQSNITIRGAANVRNPVSL